MLGMILVEVLEFARRHPSDRVLTAMRDGALPDRQLTRVLAHMDRCTACRLRAGRISLEWDELVELNSAGTEDSKAAEQELVARIQAAVRAWNDGQPAQANASRKIEDVLGVYLGKRAAAALLHERAAVDDSLQDIIGSAGSTLRILLGKKSTTVIESKLLKIIGRAS